MARFVFYISDVWWANSDRNGCCTYSFFIIDYRFIYLGDFKLSFFSSSFILVWFLIYSLFFHCSLVIFFLLLFKMPFVFILVLKIFFLLHIMSSIGFSFLLLTATHFSHILLTFFSILPKRFLTHSKEPIRVIFAFLRHLSFPDIYFSFLSTSFFFLLFQFWRLNAIFRPNTFAFYQTFRRSFFLYYYQT